MRSYLYFCILFLGMGVFSGCKTTEKLTATFADLSGEWNIVELNGKHLDPKETNQLLGIEQTTRRLFGSAGCNRMMGKVEYTPGDKNVIRFLDVATTRMACPDMEGETELLNALSQVGRFEVEGTSRPLNKIVLYGLNNRKLMVLERK